MLLVALLIRAIAATPHCSTVLLQVAAVAPRLRLGCCSCCCC
jgi:hypothetical protein